MATYTSNYAWSKPSGGDPVDIEVLNDNLDDQDSIVHQAFLDLAPVFSTSNTYAVKDVVLYDNKVWICHTAVTTAGAWTGSTNWTQTTVGETGGVGTYADLPDKPSINGNELSGNKTGAQLGLMASDGVVANPTGQTTGTLTTLEVGGTKYAVGGGSSLEAGDYIDITEGVISVKKEKGEYLLERYVLQSTGGGAPKLVVKKYIDSELISTNEYANNTAHVNIDDTLEIWYSYNPYNWHYKLLVDGVDHSAGYEYEFSYEDTTEYPVDFHISAGDSTDLVTKGDLEEVATSGSYTDLTNQPQINGNTLTGNKTTGDLGINADNVMMSDGVTSVEDAVDEIEDGLHWQFVDTITSSHSVIVPTSHEILFVALNDTLGTAFGSLTIPSLSLPKVISIPYHNNDDVILSRSGTTFSTVATGKVVRVYKR